MTPARHLVALGALAAALTHMPAHAETVTLATAVKRLADRGDVIVFSSDVVSPDTRVELVEPSLSSLEHGLGELGLTLAAVGGQWVIVAAPQPARSRLHLRSRDGRAIGHVEAEWRGRRYPLEHEGEGVYRLPIAPGSAITVLADGYEPILTSLATETPELVLVPVTRVEKVIVTGTRHRLSGHGTGSLITLSADELAAVPSLGDDTLRAVAQLPGMSSMGVSAKPRIRGGLPDELLVRVDGIELLDAYHLADFQNVFSVVDDRAVQAVDVYTGAFPARYGNRLSGVVEITTGGPAGEPRTQLGVSVFSLLANTQRTTDDGRTDYLASIRRGNLDLITREVDASLGRPRYYDAFGRIGRRLTDDARLEAGLIATRDDVTLEEDATHARSRIDSRYLWSRLQMDHGSGARSTSTLTYTWSRRRKQLSDVDDGSTAGGFLDHRLALSKLQARTEVRLERGDTLIELGAELEHGSSHYDSVAMVNGGLVGAVLGRPAHGHDIHLDPDGWSGGAYWAGDFPVTDWLTVQPGIRWDFQRFDPAGDTHRLSPRLGLRFEPAAALVVRLDAGRFHQPEALHELQAADGETSFARPQRADHFVAGLDWLATDRWELRAEVYEKRYRRVKRRYENVFNPFVLVPELEPDRVALDPDRARVRGFDLSLRHQFSEQAAAGVHYSYMDAEDRIDGDWLPRRWSQRHTASGTLAWQGPRWSAAAALTWHSGWRGARLPDAIAAGTTLPLTDLLNNVELDDFVSLDVSVRRVWRLGRSSVTAFAGVTNLTSHDNVAGIEYDAEVEDGLVVFEPQRETLLPLVPSAGVLVTF